jgi:hypothetical protein
LELGLGAALLSVLGLGLGMIALRALAVAAVVDKDVDAAVLGVLRDGLIVVVIGGLGVLGDDVPGVEEAGDLGWGRLLVGDGLGGEEGRGTYVAEEEEKDVENGVGGAYAALYPDCGELKLVDCFNREIDACSVTKRAFDAGCAGKTNQEAAERGRPEAREKCRSSTLR